MNILAIIPARMGSSRFPGKPMAKILGVPMIGHVYQNVSKCEDVTKTIVATCDNEIKDYIKSIGGEAILTSNKHERASDRCAEALAVVESNSRIKFDIVVMIQGDEPMTTSKMISQAVRPMMEDLNIKVINLVGNISNEDEFNDRNCIKVVCDINNNALYFSREPIPTTQNTKKIEMKKQVCVIPFKRDYLLKFNEMDETELERIESVDMMRIIENGEKVHMVLNNTSTYSVDTEEDKANVEGLMSGDSLLTKYK